MIRGAGVFAPLAGAGWRAVPKSRKISEKVLTSEGDASILYKLLDGSGLSKGRKKNEKTS